jgi:hypothetical protein
LKPISARSLKRRSSKSNHHGDRRQTRMSGSPIDRDTRERSPAGERFRHNFTWKASFFCTV